MKGMILVSRYPRKYQKGYTNVYHIILRSINQQEIFYDNSDHKKFIKCIQQTKEKYVYELYAYVLMNNHIHMLINAKENNMSKIMQSLAISYAMYFNKKYNRIGHVFYNRFKSKNIETEGYLLRTLRYIHFNPEKAGICEYSKYKWSSYSEYLNEATIVNREIIDNLFERDIERFKEFHNEYKNTEDSEEEFEGNSTLKLTDDMAIEKIKTHLKIDNLIEIQNFSNRKRDETIRKINEIKGIERKQLARILGLNERTIYRAIK